MCLSAFKTIMSIKSTIYLKLILKNIFSNTFFFFCRYVPS